MNRLHIEATEFVEHFFNGQTRSKFGYNIYDTHELGSCDDFNNIEEVLDALRPGNLSETLSSHTPDWYGLITDPLVFTGYTIGGYDYTFKDLARFFPEEIKRSLQEYL